MSHPVITIIIATYNSARTLDACLFSIRNQHYPQKNIEIILVDGASRDETVNIGKKYHARILHQKGTAAEAAKAHGLQEATGEIIADFGSDNIIPDNKWVQRMVRPFIQNVNIIASYPLWYTYREHDTLFNRYVSLFGVNDPVPFYLGKADRQSLLYQGYHLSGNAADRGDYYDVVFSENNLPSVGANGFFIRRRILQKARIDPDHYFHIDVIHDIVKLGYDRFAVVKTGIIHDTANTLFSLLDKRRRYFRELYLEKTGLRRYHIFRLDNWGDLGKLGLFVVYSLTIIQPLWLSIRGYMKKRDIAWFVHPAFCFLITIIYAETVSWYVIKKIWFNIKGTKEQTSKRTR